MAIVTIDFDILMHKDIEKYDDNLDLIRMNDPQIQSLDIDHSLYKKLTDYILFCSKHLNYNNIYFIENHDQICDILTRLKCLHQEIINVDFHHDDFDGEYPTYIEYNSGNWIRYLYYNQYLWSYIWWHAPENKWPDYPNDGTNTPINHSSIESHILNDDFFNNPVVPDYLILCFSSDWIPNHLRIYFDTWIALLSKEKNYNFELVKPGMIYKNMV